MKALALGVVLLVGILPTAPARAAGDVDDAQRNRREEQARTYFAIGARHFRQGELEEAIASFQAGYRLVPQPLFLFNIAQAARKSGKVELAIEYYDRYLQQEPSPTAPQRAEAEEQLARLRRRRPLPPPATNSPTPAPDPRSPTPSPALTPPLVSAVAAPDSAPGLAKSGGPARRAWWSRGWFWGTMAGVLVAGAGVGVGVWLAVQPRAPERPSLGSVSF
jgi:tetratricopeptide (TPR) repeat protein